MIIEVKRQVKFKQMESLAVLSVLQYINQMKYEDVERLKEILSKEMTMFCISHRECNDISTHIYAKNKSEAVKKFINSEYFDYHHNMVYCTVCEYVASSSYNLRKHVERHDYQDRYYFKLSMFKLNHRCKQVVFIENEIKDEIKDRYFSFKLTVFWSSSRKITHFVKANSKDEAIELMIKRRSFVENISLIDIKVMLFSDTTNCYICKKEWKECVNRHDIREVFPDILRNYIKAAFKIREEY